jgi:hypothetical protein
MSCGSPGVIPTWEADARSRNHPSFPFNGWFSVQRRPASGFTTVHRFMRTPAVRASIHPESDLGAYSLRGGESCWRPIAFTTRSISGWAQRATGRLRSSRQTCSQAEVNDARVQARPTSASIHTVMRRLVAAGLVVAVQGAMVVAPFVHAHPDDHDTPHHAPRAIHAHLSGHPAPARPGHGPEFEDDDHDRAVFIQSFFAVAVTTFHSPIVVTEAFDLAVPPERPARQLLQVVHGHDPPLTRSLPSRAPPALLS